jgi:hypothetical protein
MKPEEHQIRPAIKDSAWWYQAVPQHLADPVAPGLEQVGSPGRNPP